MAAKVTSANALAALGRISEKLMTAVELSLGIAERAAREYIAGTTRFNDRTGDLRKSFEAGERTAFSVTLKPTGGPARYAGFVEFGTRFIRPRRFGAMAQTAAEVALRNALDRRIKALNGA